jgi:hypothetical protein
VLKHAKSGLVSVSGELAMFSLSTGIKSTQNRLRVAPIVCICIGTCSYISVALHVVTMFIACRVWPRASDGMGTG